MRKNNHLARRRIAEVMMRALHAHENPPLTFETGFDVAAVGEHEAPDSNDRAKAKCAVLTAQYAQ